MYDGLAALVGAKVTKVDDNNVYFDNGLKIACEDIGNFIEITKEAE